MKKFFMALAFLPLLAGAQTGSKSATTASAEAESKDGLHFEQGSWSDVLAKAKKENKFIIMDCMTTWCGPCKHMDKNIFPLKETGDFFNDKFLAVKVQFDSTANDDARVQSWRKDMKQIEKDYAINAYPTYLIFAPNGEIVHRSVGATPDAKMFIAKGKDGLSPETQYYTQLKRYKNGEKDPAYLRKMVDMASAAYDTKMANTIAGEIIEKMTDYYTKENAEFLLKYTGSSKDKGFNVILNNTAKIDAAAGEGKSKARLMNIIAIEELNPALRKISVEKTPNADPSAMIAAASAKYPQYAADIADMANKSIYNIVYNSEVYSPIYKASTENTPVDWAAITANVQKRDAKDAEEMVAKGKVTYFQNTKNWPSFQSEVVAYMNKYGTKATPSELNNYAWTVFENCKDMTCVTQALDWSKRSVDESKKLPTYMDTYANILHKLGKTQEAIKVQEEAVALSKDEATKKDLQSTLDKMKKGEKTWTDEK